ncbi:MAG: Asp-tRNA(Asn)/Glu-tRNA(Gln) amidotransferase subunit GatC [Acetobacter sp.]|nr:Asp-tRNA(Asn)/Glu-tRNA(Gln) amidotransferase subunit GatC [Bacteroides sp.]MCM1342017.1 Asp-tRNA(Asn)/Glu-tRNA(Gln) amidotransferase subunit GatC [Acetobacter sp.]MCM1434186.1 Asp-tRNA(Asn)/Glu-tRNA(Gln) amidotransferase subunit GatC [Clostridiales bacterium]
MITKEEVLKLANLARLDFSDEELDKIIKDMDDIIAFADTINNAVEGDAEKIRTVSSNAIPASECREDVVKESLPNEKILSNVNGSKGMFCVKGGI